MRETKRIVWFDERVVWEGVWIRQEIRGHRTRSDRVRLGSFTCDSYLQGK